jgi:chitin-binding protein
MSVPASSTSATFSNGFDYNRTYSFRVYAVSSNGSWSAPSNAVIAILLRDVTPPTKPVVSASATGPTHVDLSWTCFDACPILRFDIYMNGQLLHGQVAGNSKRIVFLHPTTNYTFTVRARDAGGNWSPMSDPFVVATPQADPNDHTAPTTPPGFWGDLVGDTEAMFWFGDSTDNVTVPDLIQYHIYLNGVFDGATIHPYPNQFTVYLTPGILNTVDLYAVDEAGNRSIAATVTFDLRSP